MQTAARILVLLTLALAAGTLLVACGGDDDRESFEVEVVAARDRTDSALAQVTQPKSVEDLIVRMRTAQDEIATAAGEVGAADAPDSLADERRTLAAALSSLATEVGGTADTFEQLGPNAVDIRTLNFDAWDRVQEALTAMREAGVDVEPLGRHGGETPTTTAPDG